MMMEKERLLVREMFRGIRAVGVYYGTITEWEDGITLGIHDVDVFTPVDERIMIALSIYINVFTHEEYEKIHKVVKNALNKYEREAC